MSPTRDRDRPSPPLSRYGKKRDFRVTPEPAAAGCQRRAAVLGRPPRPVLRPEGKTDGHHVEDHPVDYAGFEDSIPAKQYGAGDVIVWDREESEESSLE
jgi:bifunctional non-homologous end joining protein LigD